MHVIAEPSERSFSGNVVATPTYSEIKLGLSWIGICLCHLSSKETTIPARMVVVQEQAANRIPNMCAPHYVDKPMGSPSDADSHGTKKQPNRGSI